MDNTESIRLLHVPPAEVIPSLTNPRKKKGLEIESLRELAADIRIRGVMQPIIVRSVPASRMEETAAMDPRPGFEVIAGERRLRASIIAERSTVPIILRDDLTEEDVAEMQLVENIQRVDLDPLEEADGFAVLRDKHGYTIAQIASKIAKDKGESYVYKRLTLTQLGDEGRAAMYEDPPLPMSIALLISRYRPEQQHDALAYVRNIKVNGEWPSFRTAEPALAKAFHLVLSQAPFDTTSADLLPEAGACGTCPKRTGNQGDIFGDSSEHDACTDTGCFQKKREAHVGRLRADFEKKGLQVVSEADAVIAVSGARGALIGYQRADAVAYTTKGKDEVERDVTFGDALRAMGKRAPKPAMFIHPHSLEVIPVLPIALAESLLPKKDAEAPKGKTSAPATAPAAAAAPKASDTPPPKTTPEEDALQNYAVEKAVLLRIFEAIRTRTRGIEDLQLIARAMLTPSSCASEPIHAYQYLGWDSDLVDLELDDREITKRIVGKVEALPVEDLAQVIAMVAVERFMQDAFTTDEQVVELANGYGIDVLAVRDKVADDLARNAGTGGEEAEAEEGATE